MNRRQTIYKLGILLLVPVIIGGELLWLFDPLRFNGWYLIDYVHLLVGAASLIPIGWVVAAAGGIFTHQANRLEKFVRCMIMITSAASAYFILFHPREVIWLAGLLSTSWLLVTADLIGLEVRRSRRFPWRNCAWFGVMLMVLAVLLWPTKYMVTYPGITMDVNRYAKVEEGRNHDDIAGVLIFERPAFPIDWLYAKLFPHYTFAPVEDLGMSLGEYNHVVRVMKQDANTVAASVALQRLGIGKGAVPQGVFVASVASDSPTIDSLEPGDVIVGLNGNKIMEADDLLHALGDVKPGETVRLAVNRRGSTLDVAVKTKASSDDPNRALLGIHIMNDIHYDVPRDIEFKPYLLHEGGPSHGAMLTLAIIDQLTPGGITNGNKVAGTGTIAADGSIGHIGGIRQKAFTVERSGADVFFVPAGQEEEASVGAEHLRIVPVASIDDILIWLEQNPKRSNEQG